MRNNQPVTQQELILPPGETLLSTTDTSGRITYANVAFIRASGYSWEELHGQPHNIVRHPDMPAEAFEDMWTSLKQGKSWTAVVKNRRKNGDHYWVRANAAPMHRNGSLVGYLSVRTTPTRSEIENASVLYSRFKRGEAAGSAFHNGLVVRKGLMRWASALQLLPAAWRVRLPIAILGAVLCICVGVSGLGGFELGALLGVLVASLALCCFAIESQVTTSMERILLSAERVASGESNDHAGLNRTDAIGLLDRAINQCGLNLKSLIADVHEQASGVQVASSEIAEANNHLASRTEEAASNLQTTAAAMEQQTASVRQNSESALQASQLAQSATVVAAKGGEVVANVASTMEAISASSRRIADIISVIDGIAFQTNILALNAAVEAARSGEQGRGFAVVASEVRSLAGRSAQAAKEIKDLIDASVKQVETGSRLAASAGKTMTEVVNHVHRVNDLISEITAASQEQSVGISSVGQAVAQLDDMTQQNAAMVEQSSAAASSMSDQALRLLDAIKVFSANGGAEVGAGFPAQNRASIGVR